jgi:hypothetical protein
MGWGSPGELQHFREKENLMKYRRVWHDGWRAWLRGKRRIGSVLAASGGRGTEVPGVIRASELDLYRERLAAWLRTDSYRAGLGAVDGRVCFDSGVRKVPRVVMAV